jgi:hypothetical protein
VEKLKRSPIWRSCFRAVFFLQIAVAGARGPPFFPLSFPPFLKMCAAETACAHICEKGGNEKGRMDLLHRTIAVENDYFVRRRPYRVEYTGSLLTSEVKRHRPRLVLGWGTAWEHTRVQSAFCNLLWIASHNILAIQSLPRYSGIADGVAPRHARLTCPSGKSGARSRATPAPSGKGGA